jgi:hypothetical protein
VWKKIFTNFKPVFPIREEKIPQHQKNNNKNDGKQITTERGIANELAAQFGKTCSTESYPRRKKQQKKYKSPSTWKTTTHSPKKN